MKIFINRKEIDITLEGEKTLGELFDSLTDWIEKQNWVLSEFYRGEEELYLTDKAKWAEEPIPQETELHFTALTIPEYKAKSLEVIKTYCQMVQDALQREDTPLLRELMEEYSYIENSYTVLLEDNQQVIRNRMREVLEANDCLPPKEKRGPENNKALIEAFYGLEDLVQGRIMDILDPVAVGEETTKAIAGLLPNMGKISLMLQTGKDRDAMGIILLFSELFQRFIRVFNNLPPEVQQGKAKDFQKYTEEVSGFLQELTEALEAKDSVLVGDLMEYEILPRVESCPNFFS